jgi:hypothetical protein
MLGASLVNRLLSLSRMPAAVLSQANSRVQDSSSTKVVCSIARRPAAKLGAPGGNAPRAAQHPHAPD